MSDSPAAVVTECDLPDAPQKVWKALTQPELLAAWLVVRAKALTGAESLHFFLVRGI